MGKKGGKFSSFFFVCQLFFSFWGARKHCLKIKIGICRRKTSQLNSIDFTFSISGQEKKFTRLLIDMLKFWQPVVFRLNLTVFLKVFCDNTYKRVNFFSGREPKNVRSFCFASLVYLLHGLVLRLTAWTWQKWHSLKKTTKNTSFSQNACRRPSIKRNANKTFHFQKKKTVSSAWPHFWNPHVQMIEKKCQL